MNVRVSGVIFDRQTDRQRDGRTDTERQPRLRLHIASRGKNTVFEIFDFDKCCDLEIRVRGPSRSLDMDIR